MSASVILAMSIGFTMLGCLGAAVLMNRGMPVDAGDSESATAGSRSQHSGREADAATMVLPQWSGLPGPPSHAEPLRPLTVDEAHREMRRHRECDRRWCPRKAAAWQTLVEARKITPDSGREP